MSIGRRAFVLAFSRRRFSGLWCAEYHGRRFTEIELGGDAYGLGSMRSGVVRTDARGNIVGVEAEVGLPLTMENGIWRGATLRFSTQEPGGQRDWYELSFADPAEAWLTVQTAPVLPFPLQRGRHAGLA